MSKKSTPKRIQKKTHLRWVKLGEMRVNPLAQRQLNPARVNKLCAEFEEEQLGYPVVNYRDSSFWVIDGQHRRAALVKWLDADDWEDFEIQCYTYDEENALTEEEEAEIFLKQNDTLTVATFEKFRIAIKADRPEESDIDRIVRGLGLRISRDRDGGAVCAVAALRKVYRFGPGILARTLRIIRDAYGDPGLDGRVIEGIGLLCQRYNDELDEKIAIEKLSRLHGGVNGLTGSGERLRQRVGWARAHCIAAAAVDVYNRGRGGKKLSPWAKGDEPS